MKSETFFCKELTINKKGTTHVVPIWFTLDEEDNILFNTSGKSIKAKNIQHDNRVRLCVDDQKPLYSFVTIDGIAELISNADQKELFKWAKIIAAGS
jgi:general stress protein 26